MIGGSGVVDGDGDVDVVDVDGDVDVVDGNCVVVDRGVEWVDDGLRVGFTVNPEKTKTKN